MDDAQVDQILERLKVNANAARQSQDAAAAAARAKPRVSDDMASESAARAKPLDVPAPSSNEPYDFEKQPEFDTHGFEPETDVHSTGIQDDPNLAETRVAPEQTATERLSAARADATRVLENEKTAATLKMKAQSRAMPQAENPAPSKSIEQLAQEDAERILGRKPMAPPEIGTMEGKSVAKQIIKVPDAAVTPKPEPTPDLSQSQVQSLVDEIQGNGKVMSTTEDAAQLQAATPKTPVTAVEDATAATIKRSVPNGAQRLAARYGAKVARETGDVAKAAKWYTNPQGAIGKKVSSLATAGGEALAKGAQVASDFNKASLARKALMMGKGAWKVGKFGAETALKDMVVPAVAESIGKFGIMNMAENAGATGRLPEMPGHGTSVGTERQGFSSLIDAQEEQVKNLSNYNSMANKYGLKVTGRSSLLGIMGVPGLNRLIAPGPNIQVQEDPTLKAAYLARNHERIKAMQANWGSQQAKGHSE